MSWWSFKPYVSVAEKRANALEQIHKHQKDGQTLLPVCIEGKKIAHTFWGKAWCDNVDSYSDMYNRLPRGRSYVRNGAVIDLQIASGKITAMVQGSELYEVQIDLEPVQTDSWRKIQQACAGQVGSLIELLQGKLSKGVMEIITRPGSGLFPKPAEIKKTCSCFDWADVCKHVAAVLYGVGARLDHSPELLFLLRQVDHLELIAHAGDVNAMTNVATQEKTIDTDDLANVFGIDLEPSIPASPATKIDRPAPRKSTTVGRPKKAAATKPTVKPKRAPATGKKTTPTRPNPAMSKKVATARAVKTKNATVESSTKAGQRKFQVVGRKPSKGR